MRSHRSLIVALSAASLFLFPACGSDGDEATENSALDDDAITVGSFDFQESVVLAEVYSRALEDAGYRVERRHALGPREFVGPALRAGLVELVPEYAGTALEFVSLGASTATSDAAATHEELVRFLGNGDVLALAAAPAQNANTFVVTAETATAFHLDDLGDLTAVAGRLTFGGPGECATRRLCLVGLTDVYGVTFGDVLELDAGGPVTRQALRNGDIDVGLMFTTDPAIEGEGFVELTDDRNLQPAENVTPFIRSEVVERWGDEMVAVIDGVSRVLTTDAVRELNAAANGEPGSGDPATVAAEWLRSVGAT